MDGYMLVEGYCSVKDFKDTLVQAHKR